MQELKEILGSPVTYSPVIARITGSINAAIFLNQLIYWWDKKSNGLLYKTIDDIKRETALSRHQQDQSIKILEELGFIVVYVQGIPPKRNFGIDSQTILKVVKDHFSKANSDNQENESSNCRKPTNQIADNLQNELPDTDKSICEKVTNQFAENSQINLPETDKLNCKKPAKLFAENSQNYTKITTKNTTEITSKNTTEITAVCGGEKNSPQNKNNVLNNFENLKFKKKDKNIFELELEQEKQQSKEKNNPPLLRSAPLAKKDSLHQRMKGIFLDYYKEKTNLSYYWGGKEGKHLKELIDKLKYMLLEKQKVPDDNQIADNFKMILENLQDKWILDKLSLSLVNSKFNEIVLQINGQVNKNKQGRYNISADHKRSIHERIFGRAMP